MGILKRIVSAMRECDRVSVRVENRLAASVFEVSLCLSRACLGKMMAFLVYNGTKEAFSYLASETSPCACLTARRRRSGTAQRRAPPSRAPYCSRGGSTDRRCRRLFHSHSCCFLPHHHRGGGHARRGSLQKRSIFFNFSPCLSRVCLGKCSILSTRKVVQETVRKRKIR